MPERHVDLRHAARWHGSQEPSEHDQDADPHSRTSGGTMQQARSRRNRAMPGAAIPLA
jgi:hypothetical protein